MVAHPFDVLHQGAELLLDVLLVRGFELVGPYWQHAELAEADAAMAAYARGENDARADLTCRDRRLELSLWHRLRPPTYRIGEVRIGHRALMSGAGCANPEYPPASADPLDGFRALARDVGRCGGSFVSG